MALICGPPLSLCVHAVAVQVSLPEQPVTRAARLQSCCGTLSEEVSAHRKERGWAEWPTALQERASRLT